MATHFIKINDQYKLVEEDSVNETDATQRGIIYIYPPEDGVSIAKYGSGTAGETLATAPCIGGNSGTSDGITEAQMKNYVEETLLNGTW